MLNWINSGYALNLNIKGIFSSGNDNKISQSEVFMFPQVLGMKLLKRKIGVAL